MARSSCHWPRNANTPATTRHAHSTAIQRPRSITSRSVGGNSWGVVTGAERPSALMVRREHDLDALELLQVGVSGGGHRLAKRPDEIRGTVGDRCRAVQDLLKGRDPGSLHAPAARKLRVVRLRPPVETLARSIRRAGERDAEHDGIRPHG